MSRKSFDLSEASKAIEKSGEGLPPLEKWNPDFCGDIDMRIARDGQWFYQGTPITRPAMVKLFSRVLWLEGKNYFLKTPVEKVGIQVEDAPFLFTEVSLQDGELGQELIFTSTTEDQIVAGKAHSLWVEECPDTSQPSPYIEVRFGMKGLIHRNAFYQLVELATEQEIDGKVMLVIESQGVTFKLGEVS